MMKCFTFITFILGFTLMAHAGTDESKTRSSRHQYIRNFKYTSCGEVSCIQVQSEGAHISHFSRGFSTEGTTELKIFKRDGSPVSQHSGAEAVYNPKLQMLTLSTEEGGFYLYSLKDENLTSFADVSVGISGGAVKK